MRTHHRVLTIGYQGSSHEDLRQFIKQFRAVLLDIRFSPRSRAAMSEGRAIAQAVGSENYTHIRALGNKQYRGEGPIEIVDFRAGCEQVRKALEARNVILLCVCEDWEECHRRIVADQLATVLGVEVEHLPGRFSVWKGGQSGPPPVFGEADPAHYKLPKATHGSHGPGWPHNTRRDR